jgi:hypothetical protein
VVYSGKDFIGGNRFNGVKAKSPSIPAVSGQEIACGRQRGEFARHQNKDFAGSPKYFSVNLSEAKDLEFLRFFSRFTPSE